MPLRPVIWEDMSPNPPAAEVEQTEVGSYFVANYPPFSVWTADAVARRRTARARTPPAPTCRWGCICTSRSAGSAAISVTSASTPTRTRARSNSISTSWRGSGSSTAEAGDCRPPARLRVLRRRARRRSSRRVSSKSLVGAADRRDAVDRRGGNHLRVRAGDADRGEARGDSPDGGHAPQPRRRELRRSHPRAERPRAPIAGDRAAYRAARDARAFRRSTSI